MEVEGFKPPQEDVVPIRRSARTHRALDSLCLNVEVEEHSLGDLNEPPNYKAAILDTESDKWVDAMNAKMQSMKDNQVWCLVDLHPNCKTVGSKWLFKKKTDIDGNLHTYKARLVAKGFTQTYGVDYKETLSPVADIRAIRILIAIVAKVCKLQRSIYGLKQASRSWNKRFDEEIKRFGFTQNLDEPCVYQKNPGKPHLTALKTILKYLRNTKDMFLVYGGNPEAELRVIAIAMLDLKLIMEGPIFTKLLLVLRRRDKNHYRLATVISDIISNTQSEFVSERQILDGPFIINEVLHWCKRKNKQAMFFKVDFAKVYDSASVLVNGSPSNEFLFNGGLKQGDPLAPYLFILVMESLHLSFSRVVDAGMFKGIRLKNMSRHKAWADDVLKLRSRLSKWKSKTLSIGGSERLGVSSFYALNRAMLLKWVWRFVSEDGSLWSRVIQAVYGSHIGSHSVHMASTWSSIMREVQLLKSKGFDFMSLCSKRVGDGSNTRFWLDVWKGDSPFCDVFPRIFALEQDKQMTVANKMAAHVSASFRRPVRGGIEQQQLSDLVTCMDSVSLSVSHDRWVCSIFGDGSFSVKDIRNSLDALFLPSWPEPMRWVKSIPIKINVFMWRARRDCLPTRSNLIHRGTSLDSDNCLICYSTGEDASHVFFQYELAQAVMRYICRWWDLEWQQWSSFSEWNQWF
ncbi:RNA-directed DNA polymerase, eukaryota [Tanacetum coccineum]|uniref:RNA-directed DNA polymerase, eukaryota n=1 Tax=Tanacetum coccineum TaxID=301880 RepID=A0ABQ5C557_9ASTR